MAKHENNKLINKKTVKTSEKHAESSAKSEQLTRAY